MILILMLVAGVILLANGDLFAGAHLAGLILTIWSGFWLAVQLLIVTGVAALFGVPGALDQRDKRRRRKALANRRGRRL